MARYIISGGGTGGHIFPAIAIGDALRALDPDCELLFVGALGRMEMTRIPQAGYPIIGLPMRGMPRGRNPLRIARFLLAWLRSTRRARNLIRDFRPDLVIGVGGYASVPTLRVAQRMGIGTVIQEQNSYAGIANKLLAKKAKACFVAYEGMERFFPADRIVRTGNPVRAELGAELVDPTTARQELGIAPEQHCILIVGGSLGARTLNLSITQNLAWLAKHREISVILQTGTGNYESVQAAVSTYDGGNLRLLPFIERMETAYAAADLIVSRAGACAISELCLVGKPVILVPSPNVAEDHQTRNAEALAQHGAALLVTDSQAQEAILPRAYEILLDRNRAKYMAEAIKKLAKPHANQDIAQHIVKLSKG